jgi:hypothetical protein
MCEVEKEDQRDGEDEDEAFEMLRGQRGTAALGAEANTLEQFRE